MKIAQVALACAVTLFAAGASAQCHSDDECRAGRACIAGTCATPSCSKDIDCPSPNVCERGRCAAPLASSTPSASIAPTPATARCTCPAGMTSGTRPRADGAGVELCACPVPPPCNCPDGLTSGTRSRPEGGVELCACAATTSSSYGSPYGSAAVANPGYRIERKRIPALFIVGASLFAVTYGATIGVTAGIAQGSGAGEAIGDSAIPIAGPWVMIGSNLKDIDKYTPALVVSGVFQASSVVLLTLGIAIRRRVSVPTLSFGEPNHPHELAVLPVAFPHGGFGLSASVLQF